MTKHVVVGIDGSPESMAAARWAGREAALRGVGVRLLNVWQAPVGSVQFAPDPEQLRFWEEARLRDAAKQLKERHPSLSVTMEQVTGTPMNVLLDFAATSEMVVLGSHGLGGISGFLYGSAGLHVLARSDQPVVLVRAADEPADPEGAAVVAGVDLGLPCDGLLTFAFEEAAARNAPLRVVHVWNVYKEYGYAAPALDQRLAHELRAERARDLTRLLAPWRGRFDGVEVAETMLDGPVAGGLVEEARRGAALLVVGRRRPHGLAAVRIGPVAHGVVHHAPCPVAVVSHA